MLEVSALRWTLTVGLILGLLALDLGLGAARPHVVKFREAVISSVPYIAVAIVFGLVFAAQVGWDSGAEYFDGYIIEKSLSIDNLFVFVIIMSTDPDCDGRSTSVCRHRAGLFVGGNRLTGKGGFFHAQGGCL